MLDLALDLVEVEVGFTQALLHQVVMAAVVVEGRQVNQEGRQVVLTVAEEMKRLLVVAEAGVPLEVQVAVVHQVVMEV